MGHTNSTDSATLATSVTNQTYVSTEIYAQPSTGTIVATTFKGTLDGNATTATKLGTSTVGNGTQPMYLNAGTPTASTSTVGSSTQPVYLNAGVVTAGTYTLGAACAKSVTDSSSASEINTGTSLVTERDVYYGLPTINGSHTYTSSTNIYAPTAVGTSGYVLKSNGSGTPSWASLGSLTAGANAAFSSVTVSSGNYISLGSVTLEPGRYVLVGYAAIGSVGNSITAVQLFWSTNSSDWGPDRYSTRLGGLSDGLVIPDIQNVRILNPTTTTTYYLVAYYGGGTGTTTINGAYGYIRIPG